MGVNKHSPGCLCCGAAEPKFTMAGSAITQWYSPPCGGGDRIGMDVTIEGVVDCTDTHGVFFSPDCGDCVRTFSNLNGTYYLEAPEDLEVFSATTEHIEQWYFGEAECLFDLPYQTCTEASLYPYFKIKVIWTCGVSNIELSPGSPVEVYLCQEDGTEPVGTTGSGVSGPSTWGGISPTPYCCREGTLVGAYQACCNNNCVHSAGYPTGQRYKFEWVTA